jgi:hypothetical protein
MYIDRLIARYPDSQRVPNSINSFAAQPWATMTPDKTFSTPPRFECNCKAKDVDHQRKQLEASINRRNAIVYG